MCQPLVIFGSFGGRRGQRVQKRWASSFLRRVLPRERVEGLPEQVDTADVAGVLLVQVGEHPPGVGGPIRVGPVERAVVPTRATVVNI